MLHALNLPLIDWIALFAFACSESAAEEHFAEVDSMKVHYTNRGSGDEALVFVHGWSCDLTFWRAQANAFAQTRVIAIDLPGHGQSDKPEINYTMDLHARAIDAVLRDAKVAQAVLVGHSNGAPVVRQFYRHFPEKTRGLILVDGALRPQGTPEQMQKMIAPMRTHDYRDYVGKIIDAMTRPMQNGAARLAIKTAMLQTPQHVIVSEIESLLADELWRRDTINVPTLMIQAKQLAWNAEYEQFVRDLAPEIDYRVWSGVSHFLMIDKPAEFNAAVSEFLKKNRLLRI